jgi:adenylate cyclase
MSVGEEAVPAMNAARVSQNARTALPARELLARLWRNPGSRSVALYAIVVAILVVASTLPAREESPIAALERYSFDIQMRLLRWQWAKPLAQDVVLVGVDEASEEVFVEPVALWHRHFARLLAALGQAAPRAVGVDVVPPRRSYDDIIPGGDLALFRAIRDLRQKTVVVFALTVDKEGRAAPMHPTFVRVIGEAGLGLDQQLRDPDLVSRRFSERELGESGPARTLVGQLLRALALPVDEGYIDYSIGSSIQYVPMQDVIGWMEAGDGERLRRSFDGRVVLVGYVNKDADRWELPVKLIDIDRAQGRGGRNQPGVVTHYQALRSQLASGLLKPVLEPVSWALALLAAGLVLFHFRLAYVLPALLAFHGFAFGAGMYAIREHQAILPLAMVLFALWAAFVVRSAADGIESMRLKRSFAGQVSPAVMKEMLGGGLSPGLGGHLAEVCVLFSDIRGFTTLSENMPPELVTTVLQRYFDRMVKAVHRFDGTVDKFIGDGMMVLFGAPRKSADPCGDAVRCAHAMLEGLAELNGEFAREGLPALAIGIGINYGSVTIGNIGSSERHNYSAIGDVVNVAARLEGLTKELGRKIVVTETVASRIGTMFDFEPLGRHEVKGHSPVAVWAVRDGGVPASKPGGGSP